MTRNFLEECRNLRIEYSKKFREVFERKCDTDNDKELNSIIDKYCNKIQDEVGKFHFSLIDGIIVYSIDKDLTINHVINALTALDIEIN